MPVERERLLAQARATGSLEPVAQRNAVKALIRDSLWSRTCSPTEILEAAYGDPEGRQYWELWLFEPLRVYQFADLLAVHYAATEGAPAASLLGMSVPVFDGHLRQIFERLRAAAEAGETWFIGDTSSLLRETWPSLVLRNCALTVRPRNAIAWMHRNPNARCLVPATPGSFRDDLVAAEQPSVQGTQAVFKSNRDLEAFKSDVMSLIQGWPANISVLCQADPAAPDDGLTRLTARGETEAIAALASQFGKTLDQTKRADVLAWLRSEDFKLSDRGFLNRVWPSARVRAGLSAKALPGAKKKN
jgi:hypothetical protein